MHKRVSILIPILVAIATIASCQSGQVKKIDELMQYAHQNGMYNGTILVAKEGEIIYKKALGLADLRTNSQLEVDHQFYLGSVSKQFTTMAVMMLNEQGKLSYHDKLSDYFEGFPAYADTVTVEHLMTHTSGIPDHYRLGSYKPGLTNGEVLILLKQQPLDFNPGEKYAYSNGGYVLLSLIVGKASGKPFHQFMKEQIFDPLGMEHTLVYDESDPDIVKRAIGFNAEGNLDDYELYTTGAGGIYSTVEDLFKWDQALYNARLISNEALEEAFTPYRLNDGSETTYGYGWRVEYLNGFGKVVSHTGSLNGFRTYLERQLVSRNTIIMLTNHGNQVKRLEIAGAIRNILHDLDYQLPEK